MWFRILCHASQMPTTLCQFCSAQNTCDGNMRRCKYTIHYGQQMCDRLCARHCFDLQVDVQKVSAEFEAAVMKRAMDNERQWCVRSLQTLAAIVDSTGNKFLTHPVS